MGRHFYKTELVCAKEIRFSLQGERLSELQFVGGGCPGHAELVTRLLKGRPLEEVVELASGIKCRNGTSCADQLARALRLHQQGRLERPLPLQTIASPLYSVAVMAHVDGDQQALQKALRRARGHGVQAVILLGDLVGLDREMADNRRALEMIKAKDVYALRGPADHQAALGAGAFSKAERQRLDRLPMLLSFHLGTIPVLAYHGGYLMDLPGWSELGPFGLEVMAVSQLSMHLSDQSVFPALTTLAREMKAQTVLFAHTRQWQRRRLGGRTFLNVGPLQGTTPKGRPRTDLAVLTPGSRGVKVSRI